MAKQIPLLLTFCTIFLLGAGLKAGRAQDKSSSDLKIGYVNTPAILQKMPKYKAVQQRMQNYIQAKRSDLSTQTQSLHKEISNYQQRQSVMSKSAKQSEQKKIGNLRTNLQQARQKAQQEIQQKQQSLMTPLQKKIQTSIKNVANKLNLSYVISASSILYASDSAKAKYNITSKVEKDLGIGK
jgi:outer membrane protein